MITSGGKHYGQIGYECKILLYEDFLVIFRTQKIIFKINLKPYIVSTNIKNKFGETFVPNRIEFKTVQRRHIEIKAIDREYDHRKVTIVLDNLSIENIESLEKLKHWTL
jgi:hypothetical protein